MIQTVQVLLLIQKSYLCTIAIHICGMLFTTTYTCLIHYGCSTLPNNCCIYSTTCGTTVVEQVTVSLRDAVALPPEFQASTQQAKSHSKARLLNSPTQGLASKTLTPVSRCSQSFKEIFQVMLKLRTEGKRK